MKESFLLIKSFAYPQVIHSKEELLLRLQGETDLAFVAKVNPQDFTDGYCSCIFVPVIKKTFERDMEYLEKIYK